LAHLLDERHDPRRSEVDRRRIDRRTAELVDLLWVTDELRLAAPAPTDEAQTTLYYVEALLWDVLPELLGDLDRELARLDVSLPVDARPVRIGSWVGGDRDGNPNVTAEVTVEVLAWMHDRGLLLIERALTALVTELSVSSRIVGVDDELAAALERDRVLLPEVHERLWHLNREEPYRLALSYCVERVRRTRVRLAEGRPHRHGPHEAGLD
ncbi:MAG: phosphoenolpyruvate carboxylase, partial [Phycisphaerales bacterium]|nr:phosphoenolpyruvate carboxylase [Phycisphaerales bacterium]